MHRIRVAVVFGGRSSEHGISVVSAGSILGALDPERYEVHTVGITAQGRWVQVQLLWPGEHNEIWLFGDGASDATWAVRRRALLTMHGKGLAKSLKQRSVVGAAALKVQEQVAAETA